MIQPTKRLSDARALPLSRGEPEALQAGGISLDVPLNSEMARNRTNAFLKPPATPKAWLLSPFVNTMLTGCQHLAELILVAQILYRLRILPVDMLQSFPCGVVFPHNKIESPHVVLMGGNALLAFEKLLLCLQRIFGIRKGLNQALKSFLWQAVFLPGHGRRS